MKKFAFFPGCVLEGSAKEALDATIKVAAALEIELVEIPGWTCCGASHVQDMDPMAALAINARNMALAEKMGLPILTVCNTCTLMLRQAKSALDGDDRLKEKVNRVIASGGYEYVGFSDITHLLWVLAEDTAFWQRRITRPLTGMKVAAYYGCHILRPQKIMNFEDSANPRSLETVIRAVGAEPVDFPDKLQCCGFHAFWTAEKDAVFLTGKHVDNAVKAGADMMATPCPLCQMQLDMYQPEGRQAVHSTAEIPVVHLAQLIGLGLGFSPAELGINRHVSAASKVMLNQ